MRTLEMGPAALSYGFEEDFAIFRLKVPGHFMRRRRREDVETVFRVTLNGGWLSEAALYTALRAVGLRRDVAEAIAQAVMDDLDAVAAAENLARQAAALIGRRRPST